MWLGTKLLRVMFYCCGYTTTRSGSLVFRGRIKDPTTIDRLQFAMVRPFRLVRRRGDFHGDVGFGAAAGDRPQQLCELSELSAIPVRRKIAGLHPNVVENTTTRSSGKRGSFVLFYSEDTISLR